MQAKFGPTLGIKKLSKTVKDKDTSIVLDNIENGLVHLQSTIINNLNGFQQLRAPRLLTNKGSGTLTNGTRIVRLEGIGQGGGGGGGTAGAGTASNGGGGASGVYLMIIVGDGTVVLPTAFNWSCGTTGGQGGTAGGGNGTAGAATTITINNRTYTFGGGNGGNGMGAIAGNGFAAEGLANLVGSSTTEAIKIVQDAGSPGWVIGGFGIAGEGGGTPMGAGGPTGTNFGAGIVGNGYGGGGSGAVVSVAGFAGGAGSQGAIILMELG